jgi:hypothetical protein
MRRWQHIKQQSKERRADCYPKQLRQGRNEKSYIGAAALGSHTQWLIESIYVADGGVNVYARLEFTGGDFRVFSRGDRSLKEFRTWCHLDYPVFNDDAEIFLKGTPLAFVLYSGEWNVYGHPGGMTM